MKQSILEKLEHLSERYTEVGALLSDSEIIGDQNRFRELSKEYAELEEVVQCYKKYSTIKDDIEEARSLLDEGDSDMREMAQEELKESEAKIEPLELELQKLLLPKDPNDGKNVFLEIRAGTGGDEAAIFSGDLFRNVYSRMKFESGAHRVQRVPETESQGRIHTSACTVAVMPEADEAEDIDINKADLRVDTFRASGAGGQHVNKTDSAIRLTHIPTGLVVECQDERSQHKNRAKAMSLLAARLNSAQKEKAAQEQASERRNLVGSGDRSERIRTYNYPQGRVTDHRINLTLYKLEEVMQGALHEVIQPLVNEYQADQLAALSA